MTGWIDLVMALMVVEAVVLGAMRRWRGVPAGAVMANLLAGFMLVLALRVALGGGGLMLVGPCLLGALGAHLMDLRGRWRAG